MYLYDFDAKITHYFEKNISKRNKSYKNIFYSYKFIMGISENNLIFVANKYK